MRILAEIAEELLRHSKIWEELTEQKRGMRVWVMSVIKTTVCGAIRERWLSDGKRFLHSVNSP